RQALERSGTVVCEPILQAALELPADALGPILRLLAKLGAASEPPAVHGRLASVEALVPAARIQELRRQLPGLTAGEGVVETAFAGYRAVEGEGPRRSIAATAESP
ncbi:MAG TPA: hypothetical protein VLW49_01255, partial [Gaiellaceae bacterium]|nr:hypothetical protein [Gaiellaceae bacterium]